MKLLATKPLPSQSLSVLLNGQACQIEIDQKFYGMVFTLLVNGVLVIGGVQCENRNRIVRSVYLGFDGDFIFIDTQGGDDPYFDELGTRFVLVYLEPSDLTTLGLAQ